MKKKLAVIVVALLVAGAAACSTVNKHVSKGFDYYQKNDYKNAEVEFLKAIEDDKDDPYAQLNLGALYQATGRPQKAIELYTKVLETGKNVRPNRKTTNAKTAEANPTLAEIARANLDAMTKGIVIKK